MSPRASWLRDQRGGALALVAVSMLTLLAVAALAVDLAMGMASRAEAQRIADAAALAGGSAFMEMDASVATSTAEARAYRYALLHTIRGDAVDSSEVTVQVIPDSLKVRVGINRQDLPTWFATLMGVDGIDVGAVAAAQAATAGEASCVKPWAIPDIWHEPPTSQGGDDADGDGVFDETEEWEFGDDPGESYQRFELDDPNNLDATGYGSLARQDLTRDYGRQIHLKLSNPQSNFSLAPGIFFPFRIPEDPSQTECGSGGGGGGKTQDSGGDVYRNNICSCNNFPVAVGDTFDIEPGNMIGPTKQGMDDLIAQDPNAVWNPSTKSVDGSIMGSNWMASPRVIKVAMISPDDINSSGMQEIVLNNIALIFIEEQANKKDDVTGRFIKYANGTGEGEGGTNTGSLVLYLRLVE